MAGKQIKQEIVLNGEKQYNAAIKEAQRNLKTLQSALKAETAELGKNATEQQKNEAKVKSLKEQIKEQEKIVQTLREALAQARAEYGDNGAEVARWEQRLNNARTTLANMKNDLSGVGDGFKTVNTDAAAATVATKSMADTLGSLGSAGESVSSAIEDIFTGMIDTVTGAVTELWDLISETASKANNWTDIAGYWGTDAQTIQQYARAVGASANSFDDLQSAVSRIVMGGKGKTIAELIGISDVNYSNEWDYAMAVMDQLSKLSAAGQDMTPIYEQIFGERRGTKIMDLVNDWETIQKLLPQFNGNESGYGMSDQELGTMNDLWVRINEIEQKWTAIKENFAAGFGRVSMDLLVNVEGTLDGIADYLNAKDDAGKQAALDKIRANVEEFFTKLGEIIRECIGILREVGGDLQGSDDPLTSAIGDILVKLADSLQWMVDNADKVKAAFGTIFGAWLIGQLAAVAGKLSGILMQIETIKAFKGIQAAGGAGQIANATVRGGGGGLLAALGLNGLAAAGAWEAAKTLPADLLGRIGGFLGIGAPGQEVLDEVNRQNGIETLGDVEDKVRNTDQAQNRKAMDFMLSTLLNPGAETHTRYEEPDLSLPEGGVSSSGAQRAAAENYWDTLRGYYDGTGVNEADLHAAFDAFEQAFEGQEDAFDRLLNAIEEKIDAGQGGEEDLPYEWFATLNGGAGAANAATRDGITSSDLQRFNGLPAGILSAVRAGARDGVSGIRVSLDGRTVGEMVAPYVSEQIARDIH